jgi:Contractile injection system tube protein/LysM domain
MPFAKLTITTEDGRTQIQALYNPEKYSVNKSVQYAEIGIPGLDEPVLQFIRGQNEKVTLDLFFDTTEQGMVDNVEDVRDLTLDVYTLLKADPETHAPPRFTIEWGTARSLFGQGYTSSLCVMESMNEEFTLFAPTGEPLRAKLTVTIRMAASVDLQFQENPRNSPDRTKIVMVVRGQRISDIAYQQYGDPTQWRAIADANPTITNPRFLDAGTTLTVPSLPGGSS